MADRSLPTHTQVAIIGGGVIGASIAYHLTQLGWKDVVVLERKKLTSGTTWHAAGLLTTLRDSDSQTKLAKYTQELYGKLEAETGQATGLIQCGSIQIAESEAKACEMRRGCAMARVFDVESHEITTAELAEFWPLANIDDVNAAFYFPHDGRVNPTDVTQAMMKGAKTRGAQLFEDTKVTGILIEQGRACGVETERGTVRADYVVNCAGIWAREVGLMAGVDVPIQAAEHYYLISEPVEGVHQKLPILRNPESSAYIREEAGGKLMVGFFEPVAAPWGLDGIAESFCFDEIAPDWERMEPYVERAMKRVPALLETGIHQFFCGPEAFTPDHQYLMGEAPNLKNYFVAAGFNSLGILSGAGVGLVISHWIVDGHPPDDVWDVNIRRIHPFRNRAPYLRDRTVESLGIGYQHHWPARQWTSARGVKKSILHDRVALAGACFGESVGWERPNWYGAPGQPAEYEYGWGRTNWFHAHAEEHRAVREAVGVFEQTSFSKLLVQGRDAQRVLNRIATADMSMPVGRAAYCHFLNERGGVEADLTISRLGEAEYLIVTPAFTHTHVEAWIREHIPSDAACTLADVSSAYVMLNVQGPKSRALLSQISNADFSNEAFPFASVRDIEVGYQAAKALRISYSGELGWELYIRTEYALPVYDALIEAGAEFGLRHCGYHALNSLRIEKAYREWSHDMGPEDSLLDAGLGFTCAWDKPGGFIGREALLAQKQAGPLSRRMVSFLLEDSEPLLYHNEPIYRDGVLASHTSSAGYGHTLGGAMAMAYLKRDEGVDADYVSNGRYEIEVNGKRYAAKASLTPMYDPKNERIRI
ncbi:MAG: GcvT family protein [Deltaproteobacteria bacterium]|jgi:4-methylaminobutanoate oxidase (formaldehyde-forming)|nr:GcvT family protein [Deltaproteobacteria bacterium]